MDKRYYFLREDYEALKDKIDHIKEEIRGAQKDKALSATETSETWHDNYRFEEAERQIGMLSGQLSDLNTIYRNVEIVEKSAVVGETQIGHTVEVRNVATGEAQRYVLGSYLVFVSDKEVKKISYNSPVGRLLLGKRIGEESVGIVGGREVVFIITNIF